MVTYTLKVFEIRKETEHTITLCFKQPALRKIKYKAGQYLTLLFRINGRRYLRPYSFSSTPNVDPLIEVTIKRVLNGIVSNHIHDQVKLGDLIEVMEPMGDFTFSPKTNIQSIYFWGVGSGITPLFSLIKEALMTNEFLKINLIYGNRDLNSTIFSNQIVDLIDKHSPRLQVWHFHTQLAIRKDNPNIVEGRINKNYAIDILKGIDGAKTAHYICGPAGLKESVREALKVVDVFPENIFSEDFELIKDPNDFENINTEIIKLKFQNIEHTLEVIKGKSILEAALDSGLELPYSCQTGSCSTCKANCLMGEVKMIGLSKARLDLHQNEYLLCCSHPISDHVFLEIN